MTIQEFVNGLRERLPNKEIEYEWDYDENIKAWEVFGDIKKFLVTPKALEKFDNAIFSQVIEKLI